MGNFPTRRLPLRPSLRPPSPSHFHSCFVCPDVELHAEEIRELVDTNATQNAILLQYITEEVLYPLCKRLMIESACEGYEQLVLLFLDAQYSPEATMRTPMGRFIQFLGARLDDVIWLMGAKKLPLAKGFETAASAEECSSLAIIFDWSAVGSKPVNQLAEAQEEETREWESVLPVRKVVTIENVYLTADGFLGFPNLATFEIPFAKAFEKVLFADRVSTEQPSGSC